MSETHDIESLHIVDEIASRADPEVDYQLPAFMSDVSSRIIDAALRHNIEAQKAGEEVPFVVYDDPSSHDAWRQQLTLGAARRYGELKAQEEARIDHLTGLPNRKAWDEHLDRLIDRANWRPSTFNLEEDELPDSDNHILVLLLDGDGFKTINDTHGHAAGDEVIRDVAIRLFDSARPDDFVARLGGDEFGVAMTVNAASSEELDEIIAGISDHYEGVMRGNDVDYKGTLIPVSLSSGVAVHDRLKWESPDDLFERADLALYAAKRDQYGLDDTELDNTIPTELDTQ